MKSACSYLKLSTASEYSQYVSKKRIEISGEEAHSLRDETNPTFSFPQTLLQQQS